MLPYQTTGRVEIEELNKIEGKLINIQLLTVYENIRRIVILIKLAR